MVSASVYPSDRFMLMDKPALMLLKWRHAGQACITANRVYVQSGIYERFSTRLVERTKQLVLGHGSESSTTMGPVTTPRGIDKALAQIEDAREHGGKVLLGGGKAKGLEGYFFDPTIILDANKEMLITHEETFAPVLALYRFDTEEEAVAAANNTSVSSPLALCPYIILNGLDGTCIVLLHQERGSYLEIAGKPRSWNDWNEQRYVTLQHLSLNEIYEQTES
jgi:succinate-semialdehyde dehydrogenase/glutarate-semialdehyde dehydrogenase